MILTNLDRFNEIVIQLHDNPDADAVGAGYAIYCYFKEKNKNVSLVYAGRNVISKSNMKLLVSELDIPLQYVQELSCPELLITVDCQYGEGNVQKFEAQNVAIIDHHSTGRQSDDMAEIRSNIVSCSSICFSMLKDVGFDVLSNLKISTALYYGLYMDSNQLSEIRHPVDRDMVDFLPFDKLLLNRLKYANFSISELETAGIAITNNNYIEDRRVAIVCSEPCDPNILGVIGDFVIQVDSIDVCVIYNKCQGGYKLSIRSCTLEVGANELAAFLTNDIGNGGGHVTKAGGFISENKFFDKFGTINIEEYFKAKMDEYYDGYDVVNYSDVCNITGLDRFIKIPHTYGYVISTDVFASGTECKIRTLEGDVLITAKDDIYIMIGFSGEAYPLEKKVFETKYKAINKPFTKKFEYAPSVIDVARGKSLNLMPYAKQCNSTVDAVISARPLDKFTKVFTQWDYEGYMVGNKGDMLCYSGSDSKDVYVIKKEIFEASYKKI